MPTAARQTQTLSRDLPDESATEALAGILAAIARPGDVLALAGDLGTGKTVLARAFIRARGDGLEEVPSPTFTLVQTYDLADGMIYHFDLYRLTTADEAFELGIDEAFADGISLIEWPQRLGSRLPAERLDIEIRHGAQPDARHVTLAGTSDWIERLKEAGFA